MLAVQQNIYYIQLTLSKFFFCVNGNQLFRYRIKNNDFLLKKKAIIYFVTSKQMLMKYSILHEYLCMSNE